MPNKKAKQRKHEKRKKREEIKKWKREKKRKRQSSKWVGKNIIRLNRLEGLIAMEKQGYLDSRFFVL